MVVLAHAADGIFAMPVLVFVTWIAVQALRDRRRERREGKNPSKEQS